jgi:hypothetical protein
VTFSFSDVLSQRRSQSATFSVSDVLSQRRSQSVSDLLMQVVGAAFLVVELLGRRGTRPLVEWQEMRLTGVQMYKYALTTLAPEFVRILVAAFGASVEQHSPFICQRGSCLWIQQSSARTQHVDCRVGRLGSHRVS